MDLNYLYHRQQISLFMAANGANAAARGAHRRFADGYAARIADLRFSPRAGATPCNG
jgi:hypothetical protein